MTYLYAFLFSGTICLICELIYKLTKFTPSHITSFLVILGSILEGTGAYKYLQDIFKGGISSLIINFGALLTRGTIESVEKDGILNAFSGVFLYTSGVVSFTIFLAIILSFLPKWRVK